MKKQTLIVIGAVLIGIMLLGNDKEEAVEAEPKIAEEVKQEEEKTTGKDVDNTRSKIENGENYENWLNTGIDEILNHIGRLEELYTELSSMDVQNVKGLGEVSEQIKAYYIKSMKLGDKLENKVVKKELSEINQYATTQGMTLSDMAKAAAEGEWAKFAEANNSYIQFREETKGLIKELIFEKQDIINYGTLKKYKEIYAEELEVIKSEVEEGDTQIEEIKKTISEEYGEEMLKNVSQSEEVLKISVIDKEHQMGKEMDKLYQSTAISGYGDIVAGMIKTDIKTVVITLYSEDDKVKSEATLETSKITKSEYGQYWEQLYIEDNMVLGEYFN